MTDDTPPVDPERDWLLPRIDPSELRCVSDPPVFTERRGDSPVRDNLQFEQSGDAARMNAAAGILRHTADLVDAEDLPQTAENTADFCDGARWATAEVRRIADAVTAEDPGWRPDGMTELAAGLGLTGPERAMLRFALGQAEEVMDSRSDEFTDADQAAVDSLKRLAGDEEP